METDCIHFKETNYFSKIILDYLDGDAKLKPFYHYAPSIESFSEAIEKKSLPAPTRSILKTSIEQQYRASKIDLVQYELVQSNLNALLDEDTYTLTTGHQLCMFSGPLYFFYKILSVITLSRKLNNIFPKKKFVPVYWMATEDHDFDEINHFNFKGNRVEWSTNQKGPVGRMKLDGMKDVFASFSGMLAEYSTHAEELKNLFKRAYLEHTNLADATRHLVNELFSAYGVVIIDGDDRNLKTLFEPIVKKELLSEFSSQKVEEQSNALAEHYKIQVNPREINLFYLTDDNRQRIIKEGNRFFINDSSTSFDEAEILQELKNYPERFSPNVLLRPLYQETILPNLAYIGGGGELAYWFQLKSTFEEVDTPLPILLLRNSALWMDEKQSKYFDALKISLPQLFLSEGVLLKDWVKNNSEIELDLSEEIQEVEKQFIALSEKAKQVDDSLTPHVQALAVQQEKALKKLSEKFVRAERRKQGEATNRIEHLKSTLFPNGGLQERSANFSEVYLQHGREMLEILLNAFDFPTSDFTVLKSS